jgi:chloramphenicol-sensitive protein RarD
MTDRPHRSIAAIGLASAVPAYLIWGLSPIYFKTLKAVPAFEILMHRMVWSFLFLLPILIFQGRWGEFIGVLRNRKTLSILLMTTIIVGFNWFLFIWAINHDHVLQTSLGYYINPLFNVLLGVVFLRERLRAPQVVAVGLAAVGVLNLTLAVGELPWVSLGLAVSFGFYGLIRKVAPVGALVGLSVETLLLTLPAVGYLIYIDHAGRAAFLAGNPKTDLLLVSAALVTALPLVLFTRGARRLTLSTMGFLQYIAPTCTFLLAVFLWHEPLETTRLWTFFLIWTALGIYSIDSVRHYRNQGDFPRKAEEK